MKFVDLLELTYGSLDPRNLHSQLQPPPVKAGTQFNEETTVTAINLITVY